MKRTVADLRDFLAALPEDAWVDIYEDFEGSRIVASGLIVVPADEDEEASTIVLNVTGDYWREVSE